MGFRYRKSINLGGGTRLNISKSGFGLSTGIKGFRVGVGPKGVRTTASIPGTGISYIKQSSFKKKKAAPPRKQRRRKQPDIEDYMNIGVAVYGETVKEQNVKKPWKWTKRDQKKAMRIAKKHRKAVKRAQRGGCLGQCIVLIGLLSLSGLLLASLL